MIRYTIVILMLTGSWLLSSCSNQTQKSESTAEPVARKIRMVNQSNDPAVVKIQPVVEKNLLNIRLSPSSILVNQAPVKNLKALESLLLANEKPVITVTAHRCVSAKKHLALMQLVQSHTTTPIALGSFGDYGDPECADDT